MHLLIAHAGALSPACAETLAGLDLPNLSALLARLRPAARDEGDEWTLSMPHERALAAALGWPVEDGRLPWGARAAAAAGIDAGDAPWGLMTPAHWLLARDHVGLADPAELALDDAESRALCDAVAALLAEDGWRLVYGAPLAWFASHESLRGLSCASPDRAIGRNVDVWLRRDDAASKAVRRLQNEVQMLLHDHPVNESREARGALPVNSFWLSGCGVRRTERPAGDLRMIGALRAPALAGDWAAWADAWRAVDAGPLAEALRGGGATTTLTLCGERHAQRYEPPAAPPSLWQRLGSRFRQPAPAAAVLEAL